MSQKSLSIAVVLFVLVAVSAYYLLVGRGGGAVSKDPQNQAELTEPEQLQLDRDLLARVLAGSEAEPMHVYRALLNLSKNGDESAKKAAQKLAKDPNVTLREGAAQALGFYDDDESARLIRELLDDKEPTVRKFAIEGLGKRAGELRRETLEKILNAGSIDQETEVRVRASLVRVIEDDGRRPHLEGISKIALAGDEQVNTYAVSQLAQVAPEDPVSLNVFRQKVSQAKNERAIAIAIRLLSSKGDPWIKQNLKILAASRNPKIRLAVVQSLHRVCPDDRKQILESIVSRETDAQVKQFAAEEAALLENCN